MSTFKHLDENGLLYLWQKIKIYVASNVSGKVDKVTGKGLSTNDLTNLLKTNYDAAVTHSKAAHAPAAAQKNSDITKAEIEAKLTGVISTHSHTITKENVGLDSVDNTSDINKPVSTLQQAAINAAIGSVTGISFSVVSVLPATGASGTIYLKANSGAAPNIYDEYIWVNTSWEKIGTTDVDLSGYVKNADVIAITNAEIDVIVV